MTAAITTPIPTIPPVATTRMSGASGGSRFRPLGIITPGRRITSLAARRRSPPGGASTGGRARR
jgi:hypothetical protein